MTSPPAPPSSVPPSSPPSSSALPPPEPPPSPVGSEVEVDVGPVAHGGHCVARHEGRVLFVRHALPGERVLARITEGGEDARFWRADAVAVITASPHRVEPPCPWARPGLCGGCDFQHVDLPAQRQLKAAVVTEQLLRLAGLEVDVDVEEVVAPGAHEAADTADAADGADGADRAAGLGWRTRVQFAVTPSGRAGLHAHRSHRVVDIDECRIASPGVSEVAVTAARWPGAASVEVVAPAGSPERLVLVEPAGPGRRVKMPSLPAPVPASPPSLAVRTPEGTERLKGRTWVAEDVALPGGRRSFRVSGGGFWQVHPGAPAALVGAVLEATAAAEGESALDLYSGVGLFAAALAQSVGEHGRVVAVESDQRAVADARRNLRDLAQVEILAGRVEQVLRSRGADEGIDVVVLDPPRAGARARVVAAIAALAPRVVAYVACDPAALARDVATFAEHGYRLDGLRAFDLFPQTHHVECVARLVPLSS